MHYKFTIKETATSKECVYVDDYELCTEEGMLFHWFMGNYACDCNREIFFKVAFNEDYDFENLKCGDERYSIKRIEREDGTTIDLEEYI